MDDIRDIIARMALLSVSLRIDTSKALRDWLDGCTGTTLYHLDLYRARDQLAWAIENLQRIKADVDAACAAAEASAEDRAA